MVNFPTQNLQHAILRDKKQDWSDIACNKGIEIKQYNSPDVSVLARAIMQSVS